MKKNMQPRNEEYKTQTTDAPTLIARAGALMIEEQV